MREIKFRAWDNRISKISKPFAFGQILNFCDKNGLGHMKSICDYHKIMQFTGLKDKNGKEIYEGDLLKICENTSGCLLVEFKNAYVGGWVLTHPTVYTWMSLGARTPDSIEVYGNIYENPELLS